MDFLKGKKILIVDDDTTTRTLHSKLLAKLGATNIHEACDVHEALAVVENEHHPSEPFDLVVSDYIMPEQTGLDLYKSLIMGNTHIPFAMVTANSEAEAVKEMIDLGISAILVKPLTLEMIIKRISKIV